MHCTVKRIMAVMSIGMRNFLSVLSVKNRSINATGRIMNPGPYVLFANGLLIEKNSIMSWNFQRRTQMIVKREWTRGCGYNYRKYKGWFLFGFIPLYLIISKG